MLRQPMTQPDSNTILFFYPTKRLTHVHVRGCGCIQANRSSYCASELVYTGILQPSDWHTHSKVLGWVNVLEFRGSKDEARQGLGLWRVSRANIFADMMDDHGCLANAKSRMYLSDFCANRHPVVQAKFSQTLCGLENRKDSARLTVLSIQQ